MPARANYARLCAVLPTTWWAIRYPAPCREPSFPAAGPSAKARCWAMPAAACFALPPSLACPIRYTASGFCRRITPSAHPSATTLIPTPSSSWKSPPTARISSATGAWRVSWPASPAAPSRQTLQLHPPPLLKHARRVILLPSPHRMYAPSTRPPASAA